MSSTCAQTDSAPIIRLWTGSVFDDRRHGEEPVARVRVVHYVCAFMHGGGERIRNHVRLCVHRMVPFLEVMEEVGEGAGDVWRDLVFIDGIETWGPADLDELVPFAVQHVA